MICPVHALTHHQMLSARMAEEQVREQEQVHEQEQGAAVNQAPEGVPVDLCPAVSCWMVPCLRLLWCQFKGLPASTPFALWWLSLMLA